VWHAKWDSKIESQLSKGDYQKFDHEYTDLMLKLSNDDPPEEQAS
jgi:hypothetical protein